MSLVPKTDEESFKLYGIPLKDAVKNSDKNSPNKTIADSKEDESVFGIDLADYASNDVSAFLYIRVFKYKRGRQTLNLENTTPTIGKGTAAVLGAIAGALKAEQVLVNAGIGGTKALLGGAAGAVGGAVIGATVISDRTREKSDYKGSIRLPLISPVTMNYGVQWGSFQSPLNATNIAGEVGNFASDKSNGRVDQTDATSIEKGQQRDNLINQATGAAQSQYNQNVASNVMGMIFNPDDELVLSGIDMRTHVFEFLLTPRNKKETKAIKDTILLLKKAMLPKKALLQTESGSSNLAYPYEFSLFFMDGRDGKEGQPLNIPPIPDCALVDMSVTYNPTGMKFHYDSNVIQYRITLQFREHQTLTADDIEEGGF